MHQETAPTQKPAAATLMDLGLNVKLGAIGISVKGEAVGPIGALQGLSQTVGVLLGSGWDNWDGKGNAPAPKPPLFGLQPLAAGDIFSDTAESAGVTKLRDMLKTAAVNDIVKKLQGLTTGTEAAADSAAAVAATVDGAATDTAAEETGATDEKAGAPTESADDVTTAGRISPKTQTGVRTPKTRAATTTDKTPRGNLVKGVKDAVKNVRNGLGADSTRKSGESTSSSSGPSTGSDSSAKKDAGTKSKHDDKK
ncbi:hypothetical protein P3H80_07075 [Mycolicibacterium septicum]|uniref:hypothetical protein n=1 Tax=Mycolicibacterium septicum TaxID=98668 RepID=UPI0023E2CB73|nr:hypothetical protein [Mycolicibacterium septicum]MDF3337174.1 hypothetical protein [Mycolicibacterium septicum]